MERKVPKYENHKIRERKVKILTRNWRDHRGIDTQKHMETVCVYPSVISSISGKSFHFPFPYFVNNISIRWRLNLLFKYISCNRGKYLKVYEYGYKKKEESSYWYVELFKYKLSGTFCVFIGKRSPLFRLS